MGEGSTALETTGALQVILGLLIGALVFFVGDLLIERMGGGRAKSSAGPEEASSGLGIVLGTDLDGIPESAVLGMSLATGDGVSMALLAAIWVSNFPEALGATVGLEKSGMPRRNIRLMWWGIAGKCRQRDLLLIEGLLVCSGPRITVGLQKQLYLPRPGQPSSKLPQQNILLIYEAQNIRLETKNLLRVHTDHAC